MLNLPYECQSISTPPLLKFEATCRFQQILKQMRYRQIIGSLIYLTITQPDLSYPIGLLSHFIQIMATVTWIVLSECYDMSMEHSHEIPLGIYVFFFIFFTILHDTTILCCQKVCTVIQGLFHCLFTKDLGNSMNRDVCHCFSLGVS